MPTCTEGHASAAEDYCDVCGAPMAPAPEVKACPACEAPVTGRFCEACGHDSALPEPVPHAQPANAAAPVAWTALVAADREFHQRVLARQGPETVEFPQFFPERRISLDKDTTLIGRNNHDKGVEPEGFALMDIAGRIAVLSSKGSLLQSHTTTLPDGRPAAPRDISVAGRDVFVHALANGPAA